MLNAVEDAAPDAAGAVGAAGRRAQQGHSLCSGLAWRAALLEEEASGRLGWEHAGWFHSASCVSVGCDLGLAHCFFLVLVKSSIRWRLHCYSAKLLLQGFIPITYDLCCKSHGFNSRNLLILSTLFITSFQEDLWGFSFQETKSTRKKWRWFLLFFSN